MDKKTLLPSHLKEVRQIIKSAGYDDSKFQIEITRNVLLKRIIFLLVSLLVLCIAGLFFIKPYYRINDANFGLELAKSLFQILFVIALGTVVSLLTAEYTRERTKQDRQSELARSEEDKERELERTRTENRDGFRKEILSRVNRAYAEAKRVRRLLRAKAFSPSYYGSFKDDTLVRLDIYDEQMQALNDIQLELEIIAKDIETTQFTFSESVKVSQLIRGMEKCLKKMVSEYEKQAGNFKGEPPTMEISSLPTLRDVVSPTEQSKIYSEFIKCYIEATQSIREDILMPQVALSSRSEQLNTPPNNSFNRSAG